MQYHRPLRGYYVKVRGYSDSIECQRSEWGYFVTVIGYKNNILRGHNDNM